jgi:ATP-dependent DNA ligase
MKLSAIRQGDARSKCNAAFVDPMECLPVSKLPEGPQWVYEIKLDGYRAVTVKMGRDPDPDRPPLRVLRVS